MIGFIFANSADPDRMSHLSNYLFKGFPYTEGQNYNLQDIEQGILNA